MTMPDLSLDRWKDLATFPSTNAKALLFLLATIATGVHLAGMQWALMVWAFQHPATELHLSPLIGDLSDGWLIFLASLGGLSVAQYIGKRKTYAAPSPDSERAGVPPTPPPATPDAAPAVVSPAVVTPPAPIPPVAQRQTVPGRLHIPTEATD